MGRPDAGTGMLALDRWHIVVALTALGLIAGCAAAQQGGRRTGTGSGAGH